MSTPSPHSRPLDGFPAFRSADVDEARDITAQFYGENRLLLAPGAKSKALRAYANHCQLEDVGISYSDFGAAIEFHFPIFHAGYSMPIAVSGGGKATIRGQTVEIGPEQTAIAAPGTPVHTLYGSGFRNLTVQLSPAAMQRKLASLVGISPREEIVFGPLVDFRRPENALWQRLVWFLVGELEECGPNLPHSALREIEQTLIITFLKSNANNYSHLLATQIRGAAPWQVRCAEDYIEAHWDQPITIEALALVTNSSARSIFYAFKQSRGYSPMAFVKQIRLRHARQMLSAPQHDTSVADVAFACGFSNLGHFAKDYAALFGERPSETLNTARGVIWVNPNMPRSRGR